MSTYGLNLFPPTMQGFIAHWTQTNAALGASPLTLKDGYTLAQLTADRAALVSAIDTVIPAVNTVQGAIVSRDTAKTAIRPRLVQFRAAIAASLPDSKYAGMLPTLPATTSNESKFLAPFVDATAIWQLINTEITPGFTPPLVLAGGYTKATFDADIAALRAAYLAVSNAQVGASVARANRDMLVKPATQRMKQYRQAVVARIVPGSALLTNIPMYTIDSGPAAQAVLNAGATWNATTQSAGITWQASPSVNIEEYSVRTAPLPSYKGDDETVLGTVGKDASLTFSTGAGLTASGSVALFKVYAVTATGRERASPTLKVTRP